MTMESAVDHDVVVVDEFDALAIEVKTSPTVESVNSVAPIPAKYPVKLPPPNLTDLKPTNTANSFYYLSGANFADCAVTYELASDRLILWVPYVEPRQVLWFGRTPGIAECLKQFDVDDVRYTTQLNKFLYRHLAPGSTLYVIHPDQVPLSGEFLREMADVRVDLTSLQPAVDQARVVKTEYEVAMIRKANA
ncbi:unnamed protein product, partial [Colletotrichum noveboracense]